MKKIISKSFILFYISMLTFVSCKSPEPQTKTGIYLGTVCTITLFENKNSQLFDELFGILKTIDSLMNPALTDSEVALINKNAGIKPIAVGYHTTHVIERGLYFATITEGAFNPAMGALISLWNIGGHSNNPVPSINDIRVAQDMSKWNDIIFFDNNDKQKVFLKTKGTALDLGGIAKGYAADLVAEAVHKAGLTRAIIDLGGNIYVIGAKEHNKPWRVGIKNPFAPQSSPIIALPLIESTLVTSGDYERFFIRDGIKYHHILDTKTGYPANNSLASVSIIGKSSMDADALATACFVLGRKKGIELLEHLQVQGIFIQKDKKIYTTQHIHNDIEILDKSFKLQ